MCQKNEKLKETTSNLRASNKLTGKEIGRENRKTRVANGWPNMYNSASYCPAKEPVNGKFFCATRECGCCIAVFIVRDVKQVKEQSLIFIRLLIDDEKNVDCNKKLFVHWDTFWYAKKCGITNLTRQDVQLRNVAWNDTSDANRLLHLIIYSNQNREKRWNDSSNNLAWVRGNHPAYTKRRMYTFCWSKVSKEGQKIETQIE